MTWGNTILWSYLVGVIPAWIAIARFLSDDDVLGSDEAFERVGCITIGFFLSFFWPSIVPGYFVYHYLFARAE